MNTADKIVVIEPVDQIVYYGNDGRCYQSQGCSILGLLEFRRWHKILIQEVEKISAITEAQPLLASARFMDFYYLSLDHSNPDSLPELFPDWLSHAEAEAIANGISDDEKGDFIDELMEGYIDQVSETLRQYGFYGTLAIACDRLLELNGINASVLTPKTFYQLLFDHVDNRGNLCPGKLIALNTPEQPKKNPAQDVDDPPVPPSDVDPTYQAIAGLVNVTQDLEKALNVASQYPAKTVNGVATAIVEQQERQRNKANGGTGQAPRKLSSDELDEVLSGFAPPTSQAPAVPSSISPEQKVSLLAQIASPH